MNPKIFEPAEKLVELLRQNNLKIATAESCTGGLVSAYITAVSGASSVLELGVTSYSNRIKNEILEVKKNTLQNFGAISTDTAKQMAENICKISSAQIGISVTGCAGPSGSEGHNAGYVIIALNHNNKTLVKELNILPKSREFVREQAVLELFNLTINYLEDTFNAK